MGYTSQSVVGAWVGNSDNTPMEGMYGSRGAGPIWRGVMELMLEKHPHVEFEEPPGLVWADVDATSGLLPTESTPRIRREVFVEGTEPTQYDDVHRPFRVCRVSGKLATDFCPLHEVETQVFDVYPPDASDWVRESLIPQPPAEYCDIHGASATTLEVAINSPRVYAHLTGVAPVIGSARPGDFRSFHVQYGIGLNPPEWVPIGAERYDRVENNILQYWDVTEIPDGLYSLRLVIVEGSGNRRTAVIPVIVDNTPPEVEIIHPLDGAIYTLESDEWVNIQVDAIDSYAMERVEFFLDGQPIGITTVAPFTHKWTIAISDTIPMLSSDPAVISHTDTITVGEEFLIETQALLDGTMITVTRSITDNHVITRTAMYTTGRGVIADTGGLTETHLIHVLGFDAAGNQAESEKVRIYTAHKPRQEKEATPTAALPQGAIGRRPPATARASRQRDATIVLGAVTPYAVEARAPRRYPASFWTGCG